MIRINSVINDLYEILNDRHEVLNKTVNRIIIELSSDCGAKGYYLESAKLFDSFGNSIDNISFNPLMVQSAAFMGFKDLYLHFDGESDICSGSVFELILKEIEPNGILQKFEFTLSDGKWIVL